MTDDYDAEEEPPLSAVESTREGTDETIVEIWRGPHLVGQVYWDGIEPVVQIFDDRRTGYNLLPMSELANVMVVAEPIVTPDDAVTEDDDEEYEEHPATTELVAEFDSQAVHRSEGGEGYFTMTVARRFIDRCTDLELAVVNVEGFDLADGEVRARPNLFGSFGGNPEALEWDEYVEEVNERAADLIKGWPKRDTVVVAFRVQEPTGESFVA